MINISVVIPYYNESSTIATTLNLIGRQSYKPKEVIFVNSSSTDSSSGIIDLWIESQVENNKVRYLNINSDSATPSYSKNIGIKNSNYEWIAFMDCGLVFSDNWLEELVRQLEKYDFKPNIVSGVCRLHGYTVFDMCAVAHTYGVGTNRVCIPGSIVNRAVFDSTGLFLDLRATYDRAWQKKTRDKNIYRITPDTNNVSYIGINFSESIINLFRKMILYSKPAVKVEKYYTPIFYIFLALLLVSVSISSIFYGYVILLFYFIIRGYFLPLYKSNDKISIMKSMKRIFLLLPFVGMVIDIGRLCGYLLGYMDRLFGNSNN